jgi:uncharacterized repeat protein (TIGR03803 family)
MLRQVSRLIALVFLGSLPLAGAASLTASPAQAAPDRSFSAPHSALHRRIGTSVSLLYSFGSAAGTYNPVAKLVADANGNLYGTTLNGGLTSSPCNLFGGFNGVGCGGVFKLTAQGSGTYTESLIYEFAGSPDGAAPYGELSIDSSGALYGTTAEGGTGTCLYGGTDYGCGTVFKLTPSGSAYTESVLYSFMGGADGAFSSSGVVADAHGNLYGTTQNGGDANSDGTVFKLTYKKKTHSYSESVIHVFAGCLASSGCDGSDPWATPYLSSSKTLYGTTLYGGSHTCADGNHCGTVWRLVKGKGGYQETVIYNFQGGTADGEGPQGGVTADASGALYGTTTFGGGANWKQCNDGSIIRGCGVVFKLTKTHKIFTETMLYAFQGGLDAAVPQAGVVLDASGDLFGTSYVGGESVSGGTGGCGTLFELTPSGSTYSESVLYRLQGCRASSTDPSNPSSGLILLNGVLYGTSTRGGKFGAGSVFGYPG